MCLEDANADVDDVDVDVDAVEKTCEMERSLGLGPNCIPPVGRNESDGNLDIASMVGQDFRIAIGG